MEISKILGLLVELSSLLSCLRCVEAFLGSKPNQNHLQSAAPSVCPVGPLGYYNGSLAVTEAGAECLNWAEFPDYVQQYPDRGLGDHNFCRNPDGGTTPWCFYRLVSGAIGWANCDCNQGAVRLAEDSSVELYFNGLWGTICADHWTDWDASVVCRQLGLSEIGTAGKKSHSGPWPVPLHLQSANCHGDEEALLQCGCQEALSGACNQGSAVVTCVPPEGKSPGKDLNCPKMAGAYDHIPFLSSQVLVYRQKTPGHHSSQLKRHLWTSSIPLWGLQSQILVGGLEGRMW